MHPILLQTILTLLLFVLIGIPFIHALKRFQKRMTERRLNHFFEAVGIADYVQTKEFKYNSESGKNRS